MRLSKRAVRWGITVSVILALLIGAFFHLYVIPFRLPQYTASCLVYACGDADTDDLVAIASSKKMLEQIRNGMA